jgi:hypothetical protein
MLLGLEPWRGMATMFMPLLLGAFANAILQSWVSRDVTAIAGWLADSDAATRDKFSRPLVETWAKQDSSAALAWWQSNLNGNSLAQAVGGVFKGAADKDVAGAAQLVWDMAPVPSRTEAAAAVAGRSFPSYATSDAQVSPKTPNWLTSLDANSARRVLNDISWQWTQSDPSTMAKFLQPASTTEILTFAYSILAQNLARKDPLDTIEWAGQLSDDGASMQGLPPLPNRRIRNPMFH